MLRLERRARRGQDITIRMSQSEPFFNKRLLRALGLALGLHLAALGFVRLESAQVMPPTIQPTIFAEIDPSAAMAQSEHAEVPLDQGRGRLPHYMLLPESTLPAPASLAFQAVEFKHVLRKGLENPQQAFAQIEGLAFQADELSLSFINEHRPVSYKVKGPLASVDIVDRGLGLLAEYQERSGPVTTYSLSYALHIENRTGEPFGIELRCSSMRRDLDQLAKQVVRSMRFRSSNQGFVTQGVVELQFELSDALPLETLRNLQRRVATG